MKTTRRIVLGWLLAAAICPPRLESFVPKPVLTAHELWMEQMVREMEKAFLFGTKEKYVFCGQNALDTIKKIVGEQGIDPEEYVHEHPMVEENSAFVVALHDDHAKRVAERTSGRFDACVRDQDLS